MFFFYQDYFPKKEFVFIVFDLTNDMRKNKRNCVEKKKN